MSISIEIRGEEKTFEEPLNAFLYLVNDQFSYGGKKYALNDQRESTDELFDIHGFKWLVGTNHKYIYRYHNLQRERDLLKIATYQFIMFLKRGFHITEGGIDSPPIDTNLENKRENFPLFKKKVKVFYKRYQKTLDVINNATERISEIFEEMSANEWQDITEADLLNVFCLAYLEWKREYKNVKNRDRDTWNEGEDDSGN